jgi:hypothetical protein
MTIARVRCPYAHFAVSLAQLRMPSRTPRALPFIGSATGTRSYRNRNLCKAAAQWGLKIPIVLLDYAPIMARELVWLENISFAAWGCSACNWILMPSLGPIPSGKPSTATREAFDRHDCAKYPRHPSASAKRPPRGCGL